MWPRTNPKEIMAHHYLLHFFEYSHLPPHLQEISKPFHLMAHTLNAQLPDNEEKHEAFRKLLEGKDCAVRAALMKPVLVSTNKNGP